MCRINAGYMDQVSEEMSPYDEAKTVAYAAARMPRFSVIVGMYQHAELVPKLIEALQRQTLQDFDVHFCDDGSPDKSLDVARKLAERTILKGRCHYHWQKNRGMRLAKSLNNGIRKARGEHCVFIMGDSFPEPDYLEKMDEHAESHRVLCGVRYHVHDGRAVDIDWRIKRAKIPHANVLLLGEKIWTMTTGNGLSVPTWALHQYGMWNEKIQGYGGDDYELVARMFYKGLTIWSIIDAKLYHHWHKAQTENEPNGDMIQKLIAKYAA